MSSGSSMFRPAQSALLVAATLLVGAQAFGQSASGTPVPDSGRSSARGDGTNTYGVDDQITYTLGAFEFEVFNSGSTFDAAPTTGARFFTNDFGFFLASPHLPNGALVSGIEIQGCNTAAGTLGANLYSNTITGGVEVETFHGSVSVVGNQGCDYSFASMTPFTVDNFASTYYVQVTTAAANSTSRFTAVRLYYHLQISPAPGSATFGDVPTTDPFFRAIEALAASGITSGCGGGNFCPDGVVTRKEIAKFLARGLGLHFKN